jgi:ribosomal protein S16
MSNLTGKQIKQIHDALLDGYNPDSLRRLVRLHLDENLHNIAGGATFTDVVFTLLEWAERHGRVQELVQAAQAENPNNVALQSAISTP